MWAAAIWQIHRSYRVLSESIDVPGESRANGVNKFRRKGRPMRRLILAAGLALFAAPAFAQKTEAGDTQAILERIAAIQKSQAELFAQQLAIFEAEQQKIEERLARIEGKLPDVPAPPPPPAMLNRIFKPRGPDEEALGKIVLPENPTKDQVREYVQEIENASRRQNTTGDQDPQIAMLKLVGPDNLDVLLDVLQERNRFGFVGYVYVMPAIKALIRDEDKEMILTRLPQQHELVKFVLGKNWTQDARNVLLEALRAQEQDLPDEWIQAVASFKDPATYDLLKWYMTHGDNPWQTYQDIKTLPGIELSQTVAEGWDRVKGEGEPWQVQRMAGIALEYGHRDALDKQFELLGHADPEMTFGMGFAPNNLQPLYLILTYTDAQGTQDELRKWYQENKDRLVFDKAAKKFVVKTD